ncbi:hypothetical protein ABZ725_41895 [Streptomyces sp. NPDC006872]|uniref:hypothetical protein n=1 Tax=Streptomyces sp. NPDC006872 TaxID=3155720 RepID=UPI0033D3F0F1
MPALNDEPKLPGPIIGAVMYVGALGAGVLLVISGKANPVEASGFVSPFLVIFEGVKPRR